MSFSFSKHAATKHELQNLVEDVMRGVVVDQPDHNAHRHQILDDVGAGLNSLGEAQKGQCYYATVSGSITVAGDSSGKKRVISIGHSVNVYLHTAPEQSN